ncbi:exodeoxyribonuclease VII large subunit [Sulfurimonas sp. SAG-AH-194-L11]|nr:exodeoxyribonuclease VII large subunit [Sulfurimonas sp. SAG-AH-194-L11]MDF1876406.1 exodeoxyribonuclease VII large subunit [Sulfurimonas sp. SAG-AH-194-L11]
MYKLSVSGLNEQIKTLLESSFTQVLVEGELSRITFHNSGHIYFTLKDSSSVLSCVMFRGNASKLKFRLEEGMKVLVNAALTLYKPRGSYQLNCFSIEPSGQGALALAYEQLKQKLSQQGYFNTEIKKSLPKFPSRIALVTSATGAALQDMLRVANSRYKNIEIDIYDVLVQGESAAAAISNAIRLADTKEYDILVVGRGGGSMEDLWAFNEEIVADAIFQATTPIISAVGHEIDWLISDFVSDIRAATPSAAMEICLPDTNELYQYMDSIALQLEQVLKQKIHSKSQELEHLKTSFAQHSVDKKLQQRELEIRQLKENFSQAMSFNLQGYQRELDRLKQQLPQAINNQLHIGQTQVDSLKKALEANNPKFKSKTGFAQLSQNSKVIDITTLNIGSEFEVQSDTILIHAKVINKESIK